MAFNNPYTNPNNQFQSSAVPYYDMLEEADSEEERMMIQKKIRKLRGER